MNYDMSSYFEDPEFKEALAKYEGMVESHTPAYFEADELIDIAEYYASKGRHKDADKAIDLAIQLHPENTDALIFRARSLMLLGKKEEAQMVMQLINNPADREFRFLQADLLIEEEHMEEADEILQQLAMDEEYELDTLLDIILNYVDVNQKEYAKKWIAGEITSKNDGAAIAAMFEEKAPGAIVSNYTNADGQTFDNYYTVLLGAVDFNDYAE